MYGRRSDLRGRGTLMFTESGYQTGDVCLDQDGATENCAGDYQVSQETGTAC